MITTVDESNYPSIYEVCSLRSDELDEGSYYTFLIPEDYSRPFLERVDEFLSDLNREELLDIALLEFEHAPITEQIEVFFSDLFGRDDWQGDPSDGDLDWEEDEEED